MAPHVFTGMPQLVDWMQTEYLTELRVRAMKPKPGKKLPKGEVTLEWGERSGDDAIQLYLLRASKVTRWLLDGAWDKSQPLDWVVNPPTDAPIALHMKVPGLLVLECGQLTIEEGRLARYRDPTPPAPDPRCFVVSGPQEVTWREMLGWLEPPDGVRLFEQMSGGKGNVLLSEEKIEAVVKAPCFEMYRLQRSAEDRDPWLWIHWSLCMTVVGHYLVLRRGALDSVAWGRVLELPRRLGACTVSSGAIRCDAEEWLVKWVPGLAGAPVG
jgi:hypothetical protein